MKEIMSLVRGICSILIIGYFGAIAWNLLVIFTPLRIWYKPLPLNLASAVPGFIFFLVVCGPILGIIALTNGIGSHWDNGGAMPTYIIILCLFTPVYFWGMRQETLHREGRPNYLDGTAHGLRGSDRPPATEDFPDITCIHNRSDAERYIKSLTPEQRVAFLEAAKRRGLV